MEETYETLKWYSKKDPFPEILKKELKKSKKGPFLRIFGPKWAFF
jgi:hypothetical protein